MRLTWRSRLLCGVTALLVPSVRGAGTSTSGEADVAREIAGKALVQGRAYDTLSHLTDRIGHRLSGSEALEHAVRWAAAELARAGVDRVWTESVLVPHWVRGAESASITAPVARPMAVLGLGGTVATPAEGITGEVVELRSLDELAAAGEAVRGKIVLFNRPLGSADGYGDVVKLRGDGPSACSRRGAVAMLIRSLGTADLRLPHTGATHYDEDATPIPAAAISAEDAELIHRLLEAGDPVRVRLVLGARTLPDAESANVLADLRGRSQPEEIVLIGAHLDSWDVGQGAHDDGAGCAIVMETMRVLAGLELRPRRTIRAVLFTNEENGLRGGKDYARRHGGELHVAAIESDLGGAAPRGFSVGAGPGAVERVSQIARYLAVLGATSVIAGEGGPDIGPLGKLGVPVLGLRQDTTRYFDYHHTEADTLDKVDRHDLERNVAALAVMAYVLADSEDSLPRRPAEPSAP